jgi:hypothetical protein
LPDGAAVPGNVWSTIPMATSNPHALAVRMQAVKDLYAELFLLLLRSVEEPPETPAPLKTDRAIEPLMLTIDEAMRDFLDSLHSARAERAIPTALNGEILRFEGQLKKALTSMHARIHARMAELEREREALKGRLQLVQRKRAGARGYRKGFVVAAAATDEPLQANA